MAKSKKSAAATVKNRARTYQKKSRARKFLVVADGSAESESALHYAFKRAENTKGGVIILAVISPNDFQHWLGVGNLMREEAEEEVRENLEKMVKKAKKFSVITPETVIREGDLVDQIITLIEEDVNIAVMVLGASSEKSGPGPIISSLITGHAGDFPIPVTIVPGDMTDEEIASVC